jgi:hypothetical protein
MAIDDGAAPSSTTIRPGDSMTPDDAYKMVAPRYHKTSGKLLRDKLPTADGDAADPDPDAEE